MTLLLLLLAFALPCIVSLDNGLAQTPWMAWSAWEVFRCTTCEQDPDNCLSERLIKDTADAMVKGGFRDAGYKIVWIDDCWALKERNATDGRLVPDPSRWPHGLKVVADYVHSLDMQLGLCACFIQSCRAVYFDVPAPFSPARSRLVPTC
jgi:alpha-N-acetylgalactosaminidase